MDWLFRGRQGGAVRGVAQRLRHDPGGRPLRGTRFTQSLPHKSSCSPDKATRDHLLDLSQSDYVLSS